MKEIPELKDNPNPPPVKLSPIERLRKWYRALPDKKQYLEVITAFLTIPVLLTVLLSNVSNLQNQKRTALPTPTPVIEKITVTPVQTTPTPTVTPTVSPTPNAQCVKEVGPIDISYPTQGATITGDPVCLTITRSGSNYCSVLWSYSINGSMWSAYTDGTICMYGLAPGVKNLQLRVESAVSSDSTVLQRTFTVAGNPSPTPTIATSSATGN